MIMVHACTMIIVHAIMHHVLQRSSSGKWGEGPRESMGRGVDWGSWGDVGDGEVVIESGGESTGGGPRKLLGSVDAARRRVLADSMSGEDEMDAPSAALTAAENRVLVVVDDKKVSQKKIIWCATT